VCQFLGWAGAATAADSDRPREVLLLYAESRLCPASSRRTRAFRSHGHVEPGAPVSFHTESSTCRPRPARTTRVACGICFRVKYQDVHLDLIMACAPRALRIALDHRGELGPRVPIVFMAVESVADSRSRRTLPAF